MEFIFKTRADFKNHVKMCGNEPRNYKILEEQEPKANNEDMQQRQEEHESRLNEERELNNNINGTDNETHEEDKHIKTQYYNIQEPTTQEETTAPTPTQEEQKQIIKEYLKNTEIIPDKEYKQIQQQLNPEPPEDTTPILDEESDTETTTTHTETTDTETPEQDGEGFIIPDITKENKEKDDIINLDINDDKIYSFYKELTIKELADNTTRKDQILKRIAEHNLRADTARLNYYKDKTERPEYIEELSGIFCDNLILSGLTTTARVKGKNCKDCGQYTTHAREFYNLRELHTRIKPVGIATLEAGDLTPERENIYKTVILKGQEIKGGFKLQNIKVATPDVPFKDVLKYHTPEHLKYLNKGGLFIHDIDYTQDVAGCIDKHNFIDYLIKRREGFYLEETDERGDPHLRIKDNDNITGRHCLTFLIVKNGMILRIKFYNKFVQSMESGSVRSNIGGHVADFVNNPETRLKDTIKKGLKCGILRIEISYYCKQNTPDENDIMADLTYLKELLKEAPPEAFFYCSIENQHKAILNIIDENLLIYDLTNKILLLCRWWNSETKKINGILNDNINTNELRHVCANLTFNKPLRVVLIEYEKGEQKQKQGQTIPEDEEEPSDTEDEEPSDTEEKLKKIATKERAKKEKQDKKQSKAHLIERGANIKINVRKYEKEGQPLTQLTDATLYPKKTAGKTNDPEYRGLTPYNNITWYIPEKRETNTRGITFKRIHNGAPLNLTSYKELKKIEKQLKEQEEDAERVRILKEQTDEQISRDEALREKAEQLEDALKHTGEKFNKKTAHNKLQEQSKGQQLEITAFYRINTQYGGTYIIYDRLSDITYYANTQLNKYMEAVLKDNYDIFNTRNKHKERAYYYLTNNAELITLFYITIKDIKRINDNKTAILNNRTNTAYLKEDTKKEELKLIERSNNTILKVEKDNNYKIRRDTANLDVLEEGKIYYIKNIKQINQGQKTTYILNLLDENREPIYLTQYPNEPPEYKPFKSNYYLEQPLNKINNIMDLNGQGIKAIQAGAVKLTPNKKRCRVITIRDI